jgi:hypothetical protein
MKPLTTVAQQRAVAAMTFGSGVALFVVRLLYIRRHGFELPEVAYLANWLGFALWGLTSEGGLLALRGHQGSELLANIPPSVRRTRRWFGFVLACALSAAASLALAATINVEGRLVNAGMAVLAALIVVVYVRRLRALRARAV